jgi:hypothetical protein
MAWPAAAKLPELLDHGLAEGGRHVPRIHRQAAHQLHQTFQSELVSVRAAGFRDSVGIKQKEVAPLQLDRSLRVVGSADHAQGQALHILGIRCALLQPLPGSGLGVVPQQRRLAGVGKEKLAGHAVEAEHHGGGELHALGVLLKRLVQLLHQRRLVPVIGVMPQDLPQTIRHGAG